MFIVVGVIIVRIVNITLELVETLRVTIAMLK